MNTNFTSCNFEGNSTSVINDYYAVVLPFSNQKKLRNIICNSYAMDTVTNEVSIPTGAITINGFQNTNLPSDGGSIAFNESPNNLIIPISMTGIRIFSNDLIVLPKQVLFFNVNTFAPGVNLKNFYFNILLEFEDVL